MDQELDFQLRNVYTFTFLLTRKQESDKLILFKSLQKMNNIKGVLNGLTEKRNSSEYQVSEIHCIELIGKMDDANSTKLSEAIYMTKGAVSKIIKKLLRYGAIEYYQKPKNKKKIYYKLTALGNVIDKKHEKLH